MDKVSPIVSKLTCEERQALAHVIGTALAAWERAMSLDSIDELRKCANVSHLKVLYAVLNDPMIGPGTPNMPKREQAPGGA